MRLISSKRTKRRIALMFVFAFMLSNFLMLIGPSAQATVTLPSITAGTCFQHSGTVANGALVTVYNPGTLQVSLTAAEISPGVDAAATAGATTGAAVATTAGSISTNADVTGNVFSITPPSGTNFVIIPGFQDTSTGNSNRLQAANATIANAFSQDATGGANDGALGISVGVVTTGTAGVGRAIVAIARDADSTSTSNATAGAETYPKSGTGSNTVTITITGLGIAIPPSGDQALSGTLAATFESTPPSGIGTSAGVGTPAISAAIPGLSGSINLCTVSSAAGQVEAALDVDTDTGEQYDKSGTSSANLLALGSISSNTRVWAIDTGTIAGGISATSLVDIEPILIRGTAGTGSSTRDQVIATGELLNAITGAIPATALDLTTYFNNSVVAPITISFADDNASATTALNGVDIIISSSTAAAAPTVTGLAGAVTSRNGFLGAARAALYDSAHVVTNTAFNVGTSWGFAAVPNIANINTQEAVNAAGTSNLGGLGAITANAAEPFHATFADLRLGCTSGTSPASGWFAIVNSTAVDFGTTSTDFQVINATQAGTKLTYSGLQSGGSTFYSQALTNIGGTSPSASAFALATWNAATNSTATSANALLYASCSSNTLTILPIQNGFDATRDIIAVIPWLDVTNISSTFTSDVNLVAQISGNNLTGTTTLNLAKLVGAVSGTSTSNLASAQGVALGENGQLGISCSSGGQSSVVLSGVNSGTLTTAATSACTGGTIATPPPFFTGGAPSSVSGTTVIDGSPTVQGEARGILITEATATGFNELVAQVGSGTQGTVFEIQLPSGCDVIDDLNDNNTAVSATAATVGNDVTRVTVTGTAGITAAVSAGGAGDAALTNANVLEPASGSAAAKVRFRLNTVGGATDAATTDAVLVRLDSQDVFCPASVTGALSAKVVAQNKVNSPTVTANLGNASLGTAVSAFTFEFADDVATSTKGETSTNSMIGVTPRLVGGGVSTVHPLKIVEKDAKSIPIGGRASPRNLDPDNSVLNTVLTRGQIWIIPSVGTTFSAAPVAADVSFSDDSLVIDGSPLLASTSTIDPNAPLGSIIIGVKKNTASGAASPAESTTTITVKNIKAAAATSTTTDVIASVEYFSQDGGVVVNTPGAAAANSATTPTVFTPFTQGSTKGSTQINAVTTSVLQIGTGTLANSLLTSRLTTEGTPQLNPLASALASVKNADASKVTISTGAIAADATPATDIVITATGAAGAVDSGADVTVTTGGTTTYDSVTVVASDDGSFTAKVRGDCATGKTSSTVTVTGAVSGTSGTSITKTALCAGAGASEDDVFTEIAGSDGAATVDEVLTYVTAQGGLAAIVSSGGNKLSGLIKAVKNALGLT